MEMLKPVVLIVEDEALIRLVAVDAFEEAGFAVVEAEHAAAALLVYGTIEVGLLFTDVDMPGDLDGIELAERLIVLTPRLRIIVTSGLPILRSVDHLNAQIVSKPYNAADVSAAAFALFAA